MKKIETHIKDINSVTTICCLDSAYSLLLYLLMEPAPPHKTLFIFGRGISSQIYENFDNYLIANHHKERIKVYLGRIYYYFYLKRFSKKYHLENLPKYGHDFLRFSDYFLTTKAPFYLIEDGLSNYFCPIQQKSKYEKNKLFRLVTNLLPMLDLHYGLSNNVKRIYLTGIHDVPEVIKDKVQVINLQSLWNNKTKEEQESILDIYSAPNNLVNKLKDSGRSILLLTQCLSEDNVMSEDEKIKIYKNILKNYDENKVIIKIHPREKTDYSKFFNSALIINERFPVQLLFLLGLEIEKVITYNSSAIFDTPPTIERVITNPF